MTLEFYSAQTRGDIPAPPPDNRGVTLPYACILAAFLLIYLPRMFVLRAQAMAPGGLDNRYPRDQQATLTGLAKRANGAHMNSFEAFAPFAAAVLVASVAHGNARLVNGLSLGFVCARALYIALYLGDVPTARSLVWLAGFGMVIALFLSPMVGH